MMRVFARIPYSHSDAARAMAADATLKPRKPPRQARSAATVACILQAAARVLARDSLAGFNTNRVAEVAGVSVGSLYQYFPHKDALVAALVEHAQDALATGIESAIDATRELPLPETISALARLAVHQQFAEPLLAAALDHEERRLALGPRLRRAEARILRALDGLLDRHRAQLDPELPREAARDCFGIVRALVEADVGRRRTPARGLESRIVRAVLGYLRPTTRPGARRAPRRPGR
jgi:AcrR family transcriptional regulator